MTDRMKDRLEDFTVYAIVCMFALFAAVLAVALVWSAAAGKISNENTLTCLHP